MMKDLLGLLAAIIGFAAYIPYFRDILTGKTLPHAYSWLIYGLSSICIFALQISHGAGAGAYTTATVAIASCAIFLLSLKHAKRDITTVDTLLLIVALFALGLWLIADQPTLSIELLVTAEILGTIPSIRKAWHKPYEETLSMWYLNCFRHFIAIAALQHYSAITVLNPLVWCLINGCFSVMLIIRRRAYK